MMTRAKVAITSQTAVRTKYLPNRDKQHEDTEDDVHERDGSCPGGSSGSASGSDESAVCCVVCAAFIL
jgi:hypothetical protein